MLGELIDKLPEDEGYLRGVVACYLSCQLGCWASCHNPLVVSSSNPSGDWLGELPVGCHARLGVTPPDWRRCLLLRMCCRIKRRVGIFSSMCGSGKGIKVNKTAY